MFGLKNKKKNFCYTFVTKGLIMFSIQISFSLNMVDVPVFVVAPEIVV